MGESWSILYGLPMIKKFSDTVFLKPGLSWIMSIRAINSADCHFEDSSLTVITRFGYITKWINSTTYF